jgi:membrane protein YqaA with SNARE-associated domain
MIWEVLGLCMTAFLSATLLPGASEVALVAALKLGTMSPALAISVATFGNVAGSIVNWAIGRFGARYRDHPRFPISQARYEWISALYQQWGVWSLLLSWLPIIGDPLTVVAGLLRTPFWLFLLLVTLGKLARYLVIAGVVSLF